MRGFADLSWRLLTGDPISAPIPRHMPHPGKLYLYLDGDLAAPLHAQLSGW